MVRRLSFLAALLAAMVVLAGGSYDRGGYATKGGYLGGARAAVEWDTMYIAVTGDSTISAGTRSLMGYYFETGGLRDSLKSNGGPYDYIVDVGNASSEFAYGHIDMANPSSQVTNGWLHIDELYTTGSNQWSGASNQIFMHWFPLDDLPGFDDSSVEVLSATYSLFWRASSYVQAAGDTIWAVGCNQSGWTWFEDGARYNTSRTYQDVGNTTAWPKLNGSTDPINWGPLRLSAISDLDYTDHDPATMLESDPVGNTEAHAWDMSAWAQDVSGAGTGTNSGIWFLGVKNGAAHSQFRFGAFSASDQAQYRTVFKMRYRYKKQPATPLQFAVFNDNHSNHPAVTEMGAAMDANNFDPAFLIHNGDMNSGDLCAIYDTTLAHQDTLAALWKSVPIALVMGNHEMAGAVCTEYLTDVLPYANVTFISDIEGMGGAVHTLGSPALGTEYTTFSVEIGNILFAFFNPYASGAANTVSSDELRWIEDTLGSSTARAKIFFLHYSSWTPSGDMTFPAFDPEVGAGEYSNWGSVEDIFEQHGVAVVFGGHEHILYSEEKNGVRYVTNMSSNADNLSAPQGFLAVSIDRLGNGEIKAYRGTDNGAAGGPFTHTNTLEFDTERTPQSHSLPTYASWSQKYNSSGTLSSAYYDSLAAMDISVMSPDCLEVATYNGLVDSVRTRNPDWIPLFYIWAYGGRRDWENSATGSLYNDIWQAVTDGDYWMEDINGDPVVHGTSYPDYDMFDMGSPGLANTLAAIYIEHLVERDNLRYNVGFFVDWFDLPLEAWALDLDLADLNRNATAYSGDQAAENIILDAWINEFPDAIVNAAGTNNFLVVANGTAPHSETYAHLYDGAMYEGFWHYYPLNYASFSELATEATGWFDNTRIDPPLILFQASHDSSGFVSEAMSIVCNGVAVFGNQDATLDGIGPYLDGIVADESRQLDLGVRVPGALWATSADSIGYTKFWNGTDTTYVRFQGYQDTTGIYPDAEGLNDLNGLPFPYEIITGVETKSAGSRAFR